MLLLPFQLLLSYIRRLLLCTVPPHAIHSDQRHMLFLFTIPTRDDVG